MRRVVHEQFGEPADVLAVQDGPELQPGDGELLVEMLLSPVHNHDLWTIKGLYGVRPALPATAGSEAVGRVVAVGEGVPPKWLGARVAAAGIRGAWAESFVVPAAAVVPVPDEVPDTLAAQLVAMPFSAIALLEWMELSEGDWVVQTAANGAVGRVFDALARARGLQVVNLVRRTSAVGELQEAGMTNLVSTSDDDWVAQVRALVGGGAAAAVDSVGGDVGSALLETLGFGGQLVVFGAATGRPLTVNGGTVIFKELRIRGFWGSKVGRWMTDETRTRLFGELIGRAATGLLPLGVGAIRSLEDAGLAAQETVAPGKVGKILLRP